MENICVEKVSKSFGGKKVFENLSLTISGGEMNCIMAPSGAGKTTLLRILMGLEEAAGLPAWRESNLALSFKKNGCVST